MQKSPYIMAKLQHSLPVSRRGLRGKKHKQIWQICGRYCFDFKGSQAISMYITSQKINLKKNQPSSCFLSSPPKPKRK